MNNPKTKHTPGPWHLIETASLRAKGDVTLMLANKSPVIHGMLYGVQDADARLIIAAPELLSLLERINTAFYTRTTRKEWLALMAESKPLLQRARGGSNE